jgi:methylglutaconyl-CoA hydratase
MDYRHLTVKRDAGVEYLTLNRPDVRNALNDEMVAELAAWAATAAADRTLRAVVLAGAGKTFCAGADVTWMAETVQYTEAENVRDAMAISNMFGALDRLPVPLIGRIHGAALGGGAGLAAVCDIVVAEEDALFGFTEVKLGILPAVISPFALAKIGRSAARELFLTGAKFSAARAREIGLLHAVVSADQLDDAVGGYIREILSGGREAIAAAKRLIAEVWEQSIDAAMPLTARTIAARRVSEEGQEGLKAFLEKRSPRWPEQPLTTKNTRDTKESGG